MSSIVNHLLSMWISLDFYFCQILIYFVLFRTCSNCSSFDFRFVAQAGCFWQKSRIFSLSDSDPFTVKSTLCYWNRKAAWKVAIFCTKNLSISVPHMTKCFSQSWLWNEHNTLVRWSWVGSVFNWTEFTVLACCFIFLSAVRFPSKK